MRSLFLASLALLLSACGVKLPPVAPQREPMPATLNLNCSPEDPDCDKTDPNYRPKSTRK
jgi:hypothetical protein